MCRHLISVWPSRRLFHSKILATTSPIANPLFCSNKFNKSIHSDSKKSVRLPSVVSSSSSASKLHTSFRSFLSISSSYDDRVNHCALLRKCNSSTTVVRSFSFRSSVRDIVRKAVPCDKAFEEKEPDDGDFEECGREEDMPQCDAVVAVLCTVAEVDVFYPWRRKQEPSYGAGLILSGRRVLTTAHSVDQYTQLEVGKEVWGLRYTATMLAVAPECDLAILTVHDDEFWNQVKPVEFGDMPSPGDKVIIDRLRKDEAYLPLVTACVLGSGMTRYSFWGTKLLAFRINVGRNGASGGGPAFDERGKCVGLKLQSQGYRSGDFVPAEVIKHFIQDYDKNGAYTGLPLLSIKWQKMENPYLRMLMKMEHDEQGVLITEVGPNYPESVILKPNDVILSIDGININNDGTVPFLSGRRIEFSYLIGKKYVGDKIVIKVRRGLEICEFTTELATHKQFVPANIIGRPLRYYIIGGFVFTTLSFPCMEVMDNRYYNDNERCEDENERPDDDKLLFQALYQEPVVLLQVLKADINAGYKTEFTLQNQVLVTFNDKPVEGLNSLVSMVETCNEDFMKFTFGNKKTLVLPTNIARSRTPDILKAHSISCAMSDDLKELVKLTQGEESPIYISEI